MHFICLIGCLGSPMQVCTQTQGKDDWSTAKRDVDAGEVVQEVFRCCGYVYCDDQYGQRVRVPESTFVDRFRPYDPLNPNVGYRGIPVVQKK